MKYLGFIINAGKEITVDPTKVQAILDWQPPTSVKGVRSFLGFANFYRCFIDGFSDLVGPLVDLTKKNIEWQWGKRENEAFEGLKRIFASKPVLLQWDPDRDIIMETDCSGFALGGCLSQFDQEGKLRPVAYYSRRLNGAGVNYPIHEKKCFLLLHVLRSGRQNYIPSQSHLQS